MKKTIVTYLVIVPLAFLAVICGMLVFEYSYLLIDNGNQVAHANKGYFVGLIILGCVLTVVSFKLIKWVVNWSNEEPTIEAEDILDRE